MNKTFAVGDGDESERRKIANGHTNGKEKDQTCPVWASVKDCPDWVKMVAANQKKVDRKENTRRDEKDKEYANALNRREQVKIKIAEQEEINRRLKEKLERKRNELQQVETEENESVQRMNDKIKENDKKAAKFKKQLETELEYSSTVGSLLSKAFQIDYKEDPGNCLCPEGKVVCSSKGSAVTCDFWNCKFIGTKAAKSEETSRADKDTTTNSSKQK